MIEVGEFTLGAKGRMFRGELLASGRAVLHCT